MKSKKTNQTPTVYVDRDGTLIREPEDFQIDSLEKLEFVPGIISGLQLLVRRGFRLVMISNQDGLGTKSYPLRAFKVVQEKITALLEGEGIFFEQILICPHFEKDGCECRKPKLGLLKKELRERRFDPNRSFVFGDRETDVELAKRLRIPSVRLFLEDSADIGIPYKKSKATFKARSAWEACSWMAKDSPARARLLDRSTKETQIKCRVNLDGTGQFKVSTGLPFFDHMLEQLAKHSLIDLELEAQGDLEIDAHHTVEDVGIILGQAIREALGDKRGIQRYAFVLPMDETKSEISIDLSGRGHLQFDARFKRPEIGGLPTELVEDFFLALSSSLQATLHIKCRGRNDHHQIESIFKGVARTLRLAVQIDPRVAGVIPSTKGSL